MLRVGPEGSGGGGGGITDIVAGPGILVTGGTGPVATITSLVTLFPPVSEAVPTSAGNLTLALMARGNVGLVSVPAGSGDNTVLMWDNAARPGFYLQPFDLSSTGATGLWNPANPAVGGNPTVDFVTTGEIGLGTYVVGRSGGAIINTIDVFLFLQQWTIGVACLYTGTTVYNPAALYNASVVMTTLGNGNRGPALVCGLLAGLLVFAVWYVDSGGVTRVSASAGVDPTLPHYAVGSYQNGDLSIQVDGGAVLTTGPFPLPTFLSTFQGAVMATCGSETSGSAEFVGSIVEIDAWNRALTPTETTELNAYYAGLI